MIKGRVWIFGDNISTDEIIPGRFLDRIGVIPDEKWAEVCFVDHEPLFHQEVKHNDIIVAGKNFGTGSSREVAALALKKAGLSCILAQSFARIFYRNCINLGLPVLTIDEEFSSLVKALNLISLDLDQGLVCIEATQKKVQITPMSPFAKKIVDAGGLLDFAQERK